MKNYRMMLMGLTVVLAWLLGFGSAAAQTQTIRGTITDAQSDFPLIGANVIVVGSDPIMGATADADGYFKIPNVPVGRVDLKITYIGYQERFLPNILVTAGKEVVLELELQESVLTAEEIVITAEDKEQVAENEAVLLSVQSFDIEQTNRYAGSRGDPARMATNFAGVSGANDSRNDIVIRGNSPSGLLWRLEGLDIPNPTHFGSLGTTGGPVSMLNNNVLANSDFVTAAFPAQYGNALSGVFDLNLRNGNKENYEFMGQLGFNGFEFGAEGPFGKDSRASFLVNYRYSMLAVFDLIGFDLGTGSAIPYYQDLSFHLNFPTKKAGTFSVFGVGGLSNIDLLGSDQEELDANDLFGDSERDIQNEVMTGIFGVKHRIFLDKKTFSELVLGYSSSNINNDVDSVIRNTDFSVAEVSPFFQESFMQQRYTAHYKLNRKFNARNTVTLGLIGEMYGVDFNQEALSPNIDQDYILNVNENAGLLQQYIEWQHRFTDEFEINLGFHSQQFLLSESVSLEPRLSARWQVGRRSALTGGYGRHAQLQPIYTYFVEDRNAVGELVRRNENLDFTYSDHFILGFEQSFGAAWNVKVETYYQNISNAAVRPEADYFSMLNFGADFGLPVETELVNEGQGRNYGLEFTLDKAFSKGWYGLLTASLFESEYQTKDGEWRNTVFNTNYVLNGLFGKEWKIGKGVLTTDFKLTTAGGRRYIPINLEASRTAGFAVFEYDRAFEEQFDPYLRADIKATYRLDGKKISQEFGIDIQNVTNRENDFTLFYNENTQELQTTKQLGMLPIGIYRVYF